MAIVNNLKYKNCLSYFSDSNKDKKEGIISQTRESDQWSVKAKIFTTTMTVVTYNAYNYINKLPQQK